MLENLKSLQIIATFTEQDLKNFKKFLQSSFFNSRKNLVDLYNIVLRYYQDWNNPEFSYEHIFKLLHPNAEFDKNTITKLFSSLFKQLESYVVYKKNREDHLSEQLALIRYYNKHNLQDLYMNTSEEIESELKLINNSNSFYYRFMFEAEQSAFYSRKDKRMGDINYFQTSTSLDAFFLYNKLKIVCLMLNRSLIVSVNYDITFLHELINEKVIQSLNSPLLNCYYLAYELLSNPSSIPCYEKFKMELFKQDPIIISNDIAMLFTYLENCTEFVYHNKEEYYSNLFDIYQQQIQNKSIYHSGNIHRSILKNMITVALKLKKTDWAESFLLEHKDRIIPVQNAPEIYYYCLSGIYFAQGRYEEALVSLGKVKPEDIFIKLAVKRTYLKIYYETNEFNVLDSNINSYRVFLSREMVITESKLQTEKDFVNIIQKMVKYKLEKKPNEMLKLLDQIVDSSIPDKSWIEEKLNAVKR